MNSTLGAVLALVSAAVWGTADFAGGVAARRVHPFQVLAISALAGVLLLSLLAAVVREPMPSALDIGWSAAAGLCGALGITSLYRGLAIGSAAIVAPVSGVLTAAVPVVFSGLTQGWPRPLQIVGCVVAVGGIWLVASGPSTGGDRRVGFRMALLAGAGFGGFLILIAQVPARELFVPLAIARVFTSATAAILLTIRGVSLPKPHGHPIALVAGVLDAGGNVFYLLARQHVRFDVAAVLSSFYPVATVVLARLILDERVTAAQWTGAAVCLAAVGLITG